MLQGTLEGLTVTAEAITQHLTFFVLVWRNLISSFCSHCHHDDANLFQDI